MAPEKTFTITKLIKRTNIFNLEITTTVNIISSKLLKSTAKSVDQPKSEPG